MQATPISSINSRTKIINIGRLIKGLEANSQMAVERRKIRRCPAVKLAARRNPNAIGWAKRLSVSIQTIAGIRAAGVPCGTRCLSRALNAK